MFSLDLKGRLPIYEQLYNRISEMIAAGMLAEDEKLPTVREIAKDLGINPNTVQKTYQKLEQDKLIYSVPAKGSYVAKRKQTTGVIQSKALDEFKRAARDAVKCGITKEQLHAEIDMAAV